MPTSALAAKQFDLRANDFATSNSIVSLKTYDSTSTYDFFLPDKNPRFLDGVSGSEQVADQVLTYDIQEDKYVWKQSASSELFIQGTTTSVGSDERGNVLTVGSEQRVVAGDPLYDPSKPQDEQVFKVIQEFTDTLFNMNQIASGKAVGAVTYDKTTGLYFSYSDVSVNPGGSNDAQKQAKDMLTLTTKKLASGSEFSQVVLKPSGGDLVYENASALKSAVSISDNYVQMTAREKNLLAGELIKTVSTCYPGISSSTATTLTQKPCEVEYSFGSDSSKFKVDNATKKMETDMTCIEFGDSSAKHRFKIHGDKLYMQKYDSTTAKWVGAEVVIDVTSGFTASLTIDSASVSGTDCAVTVTLAGTGGDHFHIMLDDDAAGTVIVPNGTSNHTFTSLYTGSHTIVAWPVDTADVQVGEKVSSSIEITESSSSATPEVNTATVSLTTLVTGTSVLVSAIEGGAGSDGWATQIDDLATTLAYPAAGVAHTFTGLTAGLHVVTAWPVDSADAKVGPKVTTEIEIVATYTASVAISAVTVTGADAVVSATVGGTGADHWHVYIDSDQANEQMPATGVDATFTGLGSGAHTVTAYPVDAAHARVGPNTTAAFVIA